MSEEEQLAQVQRQQQERLTFRIIIASCYLLAIFYPCLSLRQCRQLLQRRMYRTSLLLSSAVEKKRGHLRMTVYVLVTATNLQQLYTHALKADFS